MKILTAADCSSYAHSWVSVGTVVGMQVLIAGLDVVLL
jgi:hypothetical protein